MRYARPRCEECVRLAAECSALFQAYLDAKAALALTGKNDPDYGERRKQLDTVTGQLKEARKREDFHESTHQEITKMRGVATSAAEARLDASSSGKGNDDFAGWLSRQGHTHSGGRPPTNPLAIPGTQLPPFAPAPGGPSRHAVPSNEAM